MELWTKFFKVLLVIVYLINISNISREPYLYMREQKFLKACLLQGSFRHLISP